MRNNNSLCEMTLNESFTKSKYESPSMSYLLFELEECIATASAQIQVGGNNGTPEITDWEEKKDEQFWDF